MRNRIRFVSITLLMILSLLFAACSNGGTETNATPVAPPAGEEPVGEEPLEEPPAEEEPQEAPGDAVTIRLATWAGVEESAELQEVIDEINAEATDFQIIHEPSPQDYYTKIQTSLAGGTAADLFWLSQEWIPGFAADGAILPIGEYLDADDPSVHPAADIDDYFDPILDVVRYEGEIYGLPWVAQPVVLYYNREIFDEAGVDYPNEDWTWEDFQAAAAELTMDLDGDGNNDQWGFTMNGWPPPQMFVWQAGGEIITDDLSEVPIDSPEAIQAWEFYADMIYDDEHTPPESVIQEQGFGEMFQAGRIAMFMGGAADDHDTLEDLDVGVSLVPSGPAGRTTFAWSAATVMAANTDNPELAYEAMVMLTEGIHHWKIVAPRESLANVETISEAVPAKAESAEAIVAATEDMRAFNIIPGHQEFDDILWSEFFDALFHQDGTAEELTSQVRPRLENLLP